MKRFATVFLLSCCMLARVHAEMLGPDVKVFAAPGWESVDPLEPAQAAPPYPVLKYVPKDGRNAAVLLSLLPADVPGYEVTDLASLKSFNLMASRPYLPETDARPAQIELNVTNGLGVLLTSEDPALVGKPVPPGEYRIATTVSVLLGGKSLLHCTIFHDEKDSADLKEALKIIRSAVKPTTAQTL